MAKRFRPTLAQYRELEESFKKQVRLANQSQRDLSSMCDTMQIDLEDSNKLREENARLRNETREHRTDLLRMESRLEAEMSETNKLALDTHNLRKEVWELQDKLATDRQEAAVVVKRFAILYFTTVVVLVFTVFYDAA